MCERCKRDTGPLLSYARWKGVRRCHVKDSDGRVRDSLEAYFDTVKQVCYTCYKSLVNAERGVS